MPPNINATSPAHVPPMNKRQSLVSCIWGHLTLYTHVYWCVRILSTRCTVYIYRRCHDDAVWLSSLHTYQRLHQCESLYIVIYVICIGINVMSLCQVHTMSSSTCAMGSGTGLQLFAIYGIDFNKF